MVFDGKVFAAKIEEELKHELVLMKKKPKLVILRDEKSEASRVYVGKKKEMGERIGIEMGLIEDTASALRASPPNLGGDCDGVMVQLPLEGKNKEETEKLLRRIPLEKDVDCVNPDNLLAIERGEETYLPATVVAVEKIMGQALIETEVDLDTVKIAVVGSEGMVGKPLVARLKRFGYEVGEFDLGSDLSKLVDFNLIISAVGKAGVISGEMISEGSILIDVGFPKADFSGSALLKAQWYTPVPGGVGPVTVVCLMENVVKAAQN
ncbi:hypothetical protein A2368_01345 [Candidatus Collierbacteria bacterium RIFOXYB1_FULL_49_13]|uniref:Methenyltetrahydrofolate cyclohydrolase n=1 Tax=Candidatus Collierbacteria bacterium RIFOXYB1_FULL_49_13 TaxID=1817728 RepID=A0A1F5FIH6_9BACT|nr:MAG: hypothetical protein A2368_01345 [Candidatus Collierbacteria bacterium RIFOXYB1_FULL_49_13]